MKERATRASTGGASRVARRSGALLLAALLGLACERKLAAPPTAPPDGGPPPTLIEAVYPPARSTGVFYETAVWAQFAAALDTTTANDRTVFFKADTRRLPIALSWDPATRRLRITPLAGLVLRQTYTVELASTIRFVDGHTLGRTYAWQFTISSLRRPQSPQPMDGRREESPFVALRWGGVTEPSAGTVTYQLHVTSDSALAADPAMPPLATVTAGVFVPRMRWRQDGPNYWAIHAFNAATGERLVGPVWRFDTMPLSAPVDSFEAPVQDWDWVDPNFQARQRCKEDTLTMGDSFSTSIQWAFGSPDSTARLAGVAIEMTPRYATVPAVAGASVWYATAPWTTCDQRIPGPPYTDELDGRLADAVVLRSDRIRFSSDALAAHVEAARRLGGFYGYVFRANRRMPFYGPGAGSNTVRAMMWLYVYRPTPAPLADGSRGR